jgi:hypothetical protein
VVQQVLRRSNNGAASVPLQRLPQDNVCQVCVYDRIAIASRRWQKHAGGIVRTVTAPYVTAV